MENKFCCSPYKEFDINNLSTLDKNLPQAKYFKTLKEAKQYQKEVLKKGYKSTIEEVEPYHPFPNAKLDKFKNEIQYKKVRTIK